MVFGITITIMIRKAVRSIYHSLNLTSELLGYSFTPRGKGVIAPLIPEKQHFIKHNENP